MRGRKRRETERQKEGWSVIAYACGVKKKKKKTKRKKAAAAKHVYKLVYMSKTAQRERTHKRDQRL